MTCEVFHTAEGPVFLCGRSKRAPQRPCASCGALCTHLCDGPAPAGAKRKTCDAPVCDRCTVAVAVSDLDFCPRCVALSTGADGCLCTGFGPCSGPLVRGHDLCVRHVVVFAFWWRKCGGVDVYRDHRRTREEKRSVFRDWLRFHGDAAATAWGQASRTNVVRLPGGDR